MRLNVPRKSLLYDNHTGQDRLFTEEDETHEQRKKEERSSVIGNFFLKNLAALEGCRNVRTTQSFGATSEETQRNVRQKLEEKKIRKLEFEKAKNKLEETP